MSCYEELQALKAKYGYAVFFADVKRVSRERLDIQNRPARIKFSWSKYRKIYAKQGGVCRWCNLDMPLVRGKIEMDHINPNLGAGFNDDSNLQVLHMKCNREKSSKSIQDVSKETGKTFMEQLK